MGFFFLAQVQLIFIMSVYPFQLLHFTPPKGQDIRSERKGIMSNVTRYQGSVFDLSSSVSRFLAVTGITVVCDLIRFGPQIPKRSSSHGSQ